MIRCFRMLLMVAIFGSWLSVLEAAESTKPNIVLILADDLGYGDIGCYKKNPSKIPTPNVDRIAAEGIRFTDAHSPSSVCSPTRYALLTGRYAWRSQLQRGVLGPWGAPLIAADRMTVGTLLQRQGYSTACMGKWHLGWHWPTKDGQPPATGEDRLSNVDFSQSITQGPTTRGFDYYFGVDVPNYPPYCFIENDRTQGLPTVVNKPEFNRPGPMLPGWDWTDILPELTRRAVKYIEDPQRLEKPFFLYLPLTSPHYPVVPAPEFRGKTSVGDYGDFVHQTDWTVGQVLAALDRTGLVKNTLVIFTSDNGPEITGEVRPGAYDRVQQYQHHSMDGLRGAKRDLWEGGHRVPFMARWPNKIPVGAVSSETICHVDLMATVAAITGASLPDSVAVDSYNILPTLLNEKRDRPIREATVHHSGSGEFAIRQNEWVFIDAPTGDDNGRAGEPSWFKKERGYEPHSQPGELYNLTDDLLERRNLYAERPETVNQLRALLEKYRSTGRSTPGPPQSNDVPNPPAKKAKAPAK